MAATHLWDVACGLHQDRNERQAYTRAINILHEHLSTLVQQRFPDARLGVYGSCLSDLSLGKSSDVDLSLDFKRARKVKDQFEIGKCPVQRYESEMKSLVYAVCRTMERRKHEFRAMQPVTRARVPVIKGTYLGANNPYTVDGSIDFDVCFLNDIAFVNSSLLREYSIVDDRVKALMIAVKRWAKAFGICSSQHNTLSSYAWMNLVIFYLQNVGFVPNLQSPELAQAAGISRDPRNEWHNVNNLDTFYLKWEDVSSVWQRAPAMESVSVTSLLYGFFRFYVVEYPSILTVSIKLGRDTFLPKTVFRKSSLGFWCIEDPFETCDSHCPHNLAITAGVGGVREITYRLAQAEQYLGAKLRLLAEDTSIPPPKRLWPSPPVAKKPRKKKGEEMKPQTSSQSPRGSEHSYFTSTTQHRQDQLRFYPGYRSFAQQYLFRPQTSRHYPQGRPHTIRNFSVQNDPSQQYHLYNPVSGGRCERRGRTTGSLHAELGVIPKQCHCTYNPRLCSSIRSTPSISSKSRTTRSIATTLVWTRPAAFVTAGIPIPSKWRTAFLLLLNICRRP
jgi:DNA polymerase sigma